MQDFKGARWYKCDLHLHTTASRCFQDREVTAQQWVDRAIDQGLDCVAVTDHNSPNAIEAIQEVAKDTNLTIFPGVEITCDTSKVHLLVLFDPSKKSTDVGDFLIQCEIKREDFGVQEAKTEKSINQVADIASRNGAIVIPAHIDEFNGLESVGNQNLIDFYKREDINAVQIVHKVFTENEYTNTSIASVVPELNVYYNNPIPAIDDARAKNWYNSVKLAKDKDLAMLTFSDNPHEDKNPKHGLDGIGSRFTYIKMDETASLEGLRQAFLLPSHRIVNDFIDATTITEKPEFWIKSITIANTTLTGKEPFKVGFNPQLNTIIGGRGSGKSSILRFIRGVFNRTSNLENFADLFKEHNNFYKTNDVRGIESVGVFNENSNIEIEFIRKGFLYKVKTSNIKSSINQTIEIHKLDNDVWTEIEDEEFLNFLEFEQYSQKQIFEISKDPNALLDRIDLNVEEISQLKDKREVAKENFLKSCSTIRTYQVSLKSRLKLKTDIEDLKKKLETLDKAGIKELMAEKKAFAEEEKLLNDYKEQIQELVNQLDGIKTEFEIEQPYELGFSESNREELKTFLSEIKEALSTKATEYEALITSISQIKIDLETKLTSSKWKQAYTTAITNYDEKKAELEAEGVDNIDQYEAISKEIEDKEEELVALDVIKANEVLEVAERVKFQDEFVQLCKDITTKRKSFIDDNVTDDKIRVKINPFRNQTSFELQVRKIIGKDTSFEEDFKKLKELCFRGQVEQKIKDVKKEFRTNFFNDNANVVGGHFKNAVRGITDAGMDELELFMPEDEVVVEYKPENADTFKSLSTASAGQRTTAILTFLLSFGTIPLLLDQPEDDLDNRLVYDLIVDRLKVAKGSRQIIVVTHNANIPVNGDAEYIISMDSESQFTSVLHSGTVEREEIKKEICDVMEGSEKAFKMRSDRYKLV
ncbi:TrlF family AAA-like ATPase [Gillisia limnaea]|uniref:PHP domain protein n=1 Tax=Gillisia limnaea (strain DSM 15749 / LMG 21470 / R-8282) TaxID=865937 RepID=H2BTI7_GILLR|nr:PHP domain-containing protein [Gillisia limnaea]EHQ01573.1 PHP domain protein [Gillisia limnaea DSM 15749]